MLHPSNDPPLDDNLIFQKEWKVAKARTLGKGERPRGDPMANTGNDTYLPEDFSRLCRFMADTGSASSKLKWSLAQVALVQVTILLLHFCVGRHNDARIMHTCDIGRPTKLPGVRPCDAYATCMVLYGGKTQQGGRAVHASILRGANAVECPIRALVEYLYAMYTLGGEEYPDPLKEEDCAIGLWTTKKLHAMRVAPARILDAYGISLDSIKRIGRWNREPAVSSYLVSQPTDGLLTLAGFPCTAPNTPATAHWAPRFMVQIPEEVLSVCVLELFPFLTKLRPAVAEVQTRQATGCNARLSVPYHLQFLEFAARCAVQDALELANTCPNNLLVLCLQKNPMWQQVYSRYRHALANGEIAATKPPIAIDLLGGIQRQLVTLQQTVNGQQGASAAAREVRQPAGAQVLPLGAHGERVDLQLGPELDYDGQQGFGAAARGVRQPAAVQVLPLGAHGARLDLQLGPELDYDGQQRFSAAARGVRQPAAAQVLPLGAHGARLDLQLGPELDYNGQQRFGAAARGVRQPAAAQVLPLGAHGARLDLQLGPELDYNGQQRFGAAARGVRQPAAAQVLPLGAQSGLQLAYSGRQEVGATARDLLQPLSTTSKKRKREKDELREQVDELKHLPPGHRPWPDLSDIQVLFQIFTYGRPGAYPSLLQLEEKYQSKWRQGYKQRWQEIRYLYDKCIVWTASQRRCTVVQAAQFWLAVQQRKQLSLDQLRQYVKEQELRGELEAIVTPVRPEMYKSPVKAAQKVTLRRVLASGAGEAAAAVHTGGTGSGAGEAAAAVQTGGTGSGAGEAAAAVQTGRTGSGAGEAAAAVQTGGTGSGAGEAAAAVQTGGTGSGAGEAAAAVQTGGTGSGAGEAAAAVQTGGTGSRAGEAGRHKKQRANGGASRSNCGKGAQVPNAYMLFCKEQHELATSEGTTIHVKYGVPSAGVSSLLGKLWSDLPLAEKSAYSEKHAALKAAKDSFDT
ncbi:hypothetical protein VOLCADRAFT_100714 [Volvox carteri f. nagariensis]|uniref:HMG box domain-containing protein n=1 Tax=Volvox carteri f. nagariensis TaxID=3068 RepID=D8UKU8_VOLCA|nr:uncharacterized protein VOLCADRAFT_100714 [Volvox carteri f. nagariensis]EFJ39652.1 hypothetical protein VOLCADRAFT_100714 [Volvox carteri f. nagariensis]|eukprot:XP_002959282.1 hypothetical protein VOLCADRAFT_100714 [Volvox carteri f. nagariensis]